MWYNSKSSWDLAELVTVTDPNKTTGIDAKLPQAGATTITTISDTTPTTSSESCLSEKIYGDNSEQKELIKIFQR